MHNKETDNLPEPDCIPGCLHPRRTYDLVGHETAEKLFKKHRIRHIPVVKGSTIIGMLSYTDLLRISFADSAFDDDDVGLTPVVKGSDVVLL